MAALDQEIMKDIRRGILWCLKTVQGHEVNEHILLAELRSSGGHPTLTHSSLRRHLQYLAEPDKGYITLKYIEAADMYVANITGKGCDVSDGVIFDPGVSRDE